MPAPSHAQWVLVADDDERVRGVWCEALQRAGYRTLAARNGREAIDLMRTAQVDLLLLDLRMPDVGGEGVLQHMRDTPGLARLPVLVISGFLDPEERLPTRDVNIVGSLAKPVGIRNLVDAVRFGLRGGTASDPTS